MEPKRTQCTRILINSDLFHSIFFLRMEIRFRNYKPRGAELQAQTAPVAATVSKAMGAKLDETVKATIADDNDELVILPTDEAEDLRRILDPRLRILERQTQEAIVELIKQKMSTEIGGAAAGEAAAGAGGAAGSID